MSDPEGLTPTKDVLRNKNETHERITFSARFACPVSGFTIDEIEPRLFSFNAPAGACPKCDGLGTELRFEADLVVPDADAEPQAGRGLSLGQDRQHLALLRADAGGAGQALQGVDDDALGEAAQEGAGRHPATAPARRRSTSSTRTACARYTNTKPFEGVIGNIERRFRETDSDWVREELSRYQDAHPCDACGGYRLKPQALAVKIDGLHIGQVDGPVDPRRQRLVRRAAEEAHQEAERDRHPHPQGDPRAAAVPGRRRPRLSHAVARGRHAVGRREPAHPAGLADRLGPHRRALRAGRALHRPAPARQRPPAGDAQAPARHRQHRDRGRARRGRDPHRRPRGRHRPGRRHPRRPHRRPGHARRDHGQRRQHHRPVPHRRAPDPDAEDAAQAQRQVAEGDRRAREQPEGRHGRDPARPVHLRSPACRAAASPRC